MINCFNVVSLLLAGSFLIGAGTPEAVPAARRRTVEWESVPFTLLSPAGEREVTLSSFGGRREWANAEEDVLAFCRLNAREAVDAKLFFDGQAFTYVPEQKGVYCDYARSLKNALTAMEEGRAESEIITVEYEPKVTVKTLKARTKRLGAFTTYFDGANLPRVHNIALAASRISGTEILPHAEFSFNAAVGKRTEKNGFEIANVIQGGEFVPGVGGGVCQASTTLMNAALLSGLSITESRAHSLSVGYIRPSLDAMVSEYCDLKFVNPYEFPVYLSAVTGENFVRFIVYGKPDGRRYEIESEVLRRIPPPPAEIREGEEEKVVRNEKEGIASESYLLVYDSAGNLISRTLFRRDTYASVQGIYEIPPAVEENTENGQEKNSEIR
ncbi:MAG: VanW family protein [Clostridia bacterium]|nr:VanW family protein [Clostridia bacterium]